MSSIVDLEISLSRHDRSTYTIELRYHDPDDAEMRPPERGRVKFDHKKLEDQWDDPVAYGTLLFNQLFAPDNVRKLFDTIMGIIQNNNREARLRLFIERDADDLHRERWETLFDARPGAGWLLTDRRIRFSRFLANPRWEATNTRAKENLRALVVIANPSDVGQFGPVTAPLSPIKVTEELERAKLSLGDLYKDEHVLVTDPAASKWVTKKALCTCLKTGFDVVYLACHGLLDDSCDPPVPFLLLQDSAGNGDLVPGSEIADEIQKLDPSVRPRLFVLASCKSAGTGSGGADETADKSGALVATGPQISMAGVPAVLAMQGSITMETVSGFMPVFFTDLLTDGQIDRAVAKARSEVAGRFDSWMPVLYLRLRDGCLWYEPRFNGQNPEMIWGRLLNGIADNVQITPVIGSCLSDFYCGTLRQLALRFADQANYPMSERYRDELPQIAQFLANRDGPGAPRGTLLRHLKELVGQRFAAELPPGLEAGSIEELLFKQAAEIADKRKDDREYPYWVLAHLPFHIYVNTNYDDLLTQALKKANRHPVVDYARWKEILRVKPSNYERECQQNNYEPTQDHPLVFHLFGMLAERDSLILSEDDYFDYLMWVNQSKASLPPPVGMSLRFNGLLFLGFGINDWNFRVVFRSILNEETRKISRNYKSVAVQVRPGGDILEPEAARMYLEQHYGGMDIGVYWGSVEDFIKDLCKRTEKAGLLL
jgi:hypothetical protein